MAKKNSVIRKKHIDNFFYNLAKVYIVFEVCEWGGSLGGLIVSRQADELMRAARRESGSREQLNGSGSLRRQGGSVGGWECQDWPYLPLSCLLTWGQGQRTNHNKSRDLQPPANENTPQTNFLLALKSFSLSITDFVLFFLFCCRF